LSWSKSLPGGWKQTAFHPSCTRPRWPNISKYCGFFFDGALARARLPAKLVPSISICLTPLITLGGLTPTTSSSVGARSLAWQN
jgi:hypothetical protein